MLGRAIEKIEDLVGFAKLRRLDLSKNRLKRLSGMQHVTDTLTMLNLADNEFQSDKAFEEFRYLKNLRTLNIGGNVNVLKLESHVAKPLEKLQALVAHQCGFSRASFVKFLPNLNTLVLSKNRISKFDTSCSENLTALTKLSLGNNKIRSWPSLEACELLQELRLNNNFIDVIPERVLRNKKIKILDLANNEIQEWKNIRVLPGFAHLTNLCLKGNPLPNPQDASSIVLREDYALEKNPLSEDEELYRRFVLSMFQSNVGEKGLPKIKLIVFDMKRVKMKFSHTRDQKGEAQPSAKRQKIGTKRPLQVGEVDYSIELDFKPTAKIVREFEPDRLERDQDQWPMNLLGEEKRLKKDKKNKKAKRKDKEEYREMILEEMVMSEDESLDGLCKNYVPNEHEERSSTDVATSGVVKNKHIRKEKKDKKATSRSTVGSLNENTTKGNDCDSAFCNINVQEVLSGRSSVMNTFGKGGSGSAW